MISVVLTTYNEKLSDLKSSVHSILNQTFTDIELIVIVDNPDANEHILYLSSLDDPRLKLCINDVNLGLVASLNLGLQVAKGDYIARMDADDIAYATRLVDELEFLKLHNLDIVASTFRTINSEGCVISPPNVWRDVVNQSEIRKILLNINIFCHPSWLVRKSVYKELSGYNDVKYAEDYDFLVRAFSAGYKIGYMSKPLLDYRYRSESISRSCALKQLHTFYGISNYFRRKKTMDYEKIRERVSVVDEDSELFFQDLIKLGKQVITTKSMGTTFTFLMKMTQRPSNIIILIRDRVAKIQLNRLLR